MSLLGPVGICAYSGANLNIAETETIGLDMTAVWDQAGRTIIYVRTTLTIRTVVYSSNIGDVDNTIATLRQALMTPCGPLVWSGKGGGTITANVVGNPSRDVMYGPKPQYFRVSKIHQLASAIEWQVVVCLPFQCVMPDYQGMPLEVNFKLGFRIDESGWTTRTYSGHMIIAVTRDSPTEIALSDNADDYRNLIVPDPLTNFRRMNQDYTVDEAKSRLDFTVVDQEMGRNIPPPGIISVKASDEHSTSGLGMSKCKGTISASYELQKGTDSSVARAHFLALVNDRLGAMRAEIALANTAEGNPGAKIMCFPNGYTVSEPDIFGKTECRFTAPYQFALPISLANLLYSTGLWRLSPGLPPAAVPTTWSQWSASLQGVFGNQGRGLAQLGFSNDDEIIIDLCLGQPPEPTVSTLTQGVPNQPILKQAQLVNPPPDPINSFFLYESTISLVTADGTIEQKPLAMGAIANLSGPDGVQGNFGNSIGYVPNQPQSLGVIPPTIIQQRCNQSNQIVLSGRCLRYGLPPNAPQLVSIGGVPCTPMTMEGDGFAQETVGNVGFPVYMGQWQLRWVIPSAPSVLPSAPNPYLDGSTTLNGNTIVLSSVDNTANESTSPNSSSTLRSASGITNANFG